MYGEFLSWDLAEAGSQLPLKPGQSVAVAVGVRVKLDFSGQESLLQELNDGEPGAGSRGNVPSTRTRTHRDAHRHAHKLCHLHAQAHIHRHTHTQGHKLCHLNTHIQTYTRTHTRARAHTHMPAHKL